MSYESSAAEVAEDYRQALEDLTTNVRFEISNLTMIAREQTEHAQVISEVLQDHILKVGHTPHCFLVPARAPSASLFPAAASEAARL
ncbi:uncharacterized protein ColSpa_09555 [Colletotrichum spaethianum]|uniref:Uncharacterized protein n=1 Tax=Colletotrichum spaethianum TaxID=700344 RepID=A0AA37PBX4_9PEZI|nr:uncharacterized protein ColSpa_09555 [Colletotrichum spaethianum]GKT49374.1 hypothetical protein ColSpa_09555 [Colletotrichum spaethianum]